MIKKIKLTSLTIRLQLPALTFCWHCFYDFCCHCRSKSVAISVPCDFVVVADNTTGVKFLMAPPKSAKF
ncbi:MAG: hypothetical protein ACK51L_05145 [bacterium]